jgi:hypothetical protein
LWTKSAAFAKVVAMTSSGWVLLNLWTVVGPTPSKLTAIPEVDRSMTTTFQSVLDWALFYHREGLSVIPLKSEPASDRKRPAIEWKEYSEQRASEDQVRQWFGNGSNYNIAVVMGKVSGCALGIDIDGPLAWQHFEAKLAAAGWYGNLSTVLKNTMMNKTGSGGYHVIVKVDPGDYDQVRHIIKNNEIWSSEEAHSQIRIQTEGMYLVMPPSVHPNGRTYEWNEKLPSLVSADDLAQFVKLVGTNIGPSPAHSSDGEHKHVRTLGEEEAANEPKSSGASSLDPDRMNQLLQIVRPYYTEGKRDAWVFHLSGTMRKDGLVPLKNARSFIKLLANATQDPELRSRLDVVTNTYQQPLDRINGKSGLRELITAGYNGKEDLRKRLEDYVMIMKIIVRQEIQEEIVPLTDDLTREVALDNIAAILSTSVKRDDSAKKITFCAMLLAQTNSSQVNIGFQAESSAGKSYLPIELSSYFPPSEVSLIASASPTAFFHDRGEWNKEVGTLKVVLEGKILVFLDMPGYQLLERLRPLLSHDRKVLYYKITDRSKNAALRTKNIELVGYPCVIFCSAKLDADEQERTRMILLSPSVDEEKLRESLMLTSLKNSDPDKYCELVENDPSRKWLINRIKTIRQSGIKEVRIPNYQTLVHKRFLEEHLHLKARHQRDLPRIINLIKSHALLNCFNRQRQGDTIEAAEQDINAGFDLYKEISEANEAGLSPYIYKIYMEVIKPHLDEEDGLDKKQIQKEYYRVFHKTISPSALNDIFSHLEAANLIELQQDPVDKRRTLVFPPEK